VKGKWRIVKMLDYTANTPMVMKPTSPRDHAGLLQQPARLGHDPEKWTPVFGKDHAQANDKS
jgi:hypothetical protein